MIVAPEQRQACSLLPELGGAMRALRALTALDNCRTDVNAFPKREEAADSCRG